MTRTPTLPVLPFSIPAATHDETAPRSMPVRRCYKPAPTMGPMPMRLFEYAESQGWKCTIRQAADALGIPVRTAHSRAARGGFVHRFAGYAPRALAKGEYYENEARGAMGAQARGFGFDINLIPIDKLIR